MSTSWPVVPLSDVASIERDAVQAADIEEGTLYVGLENIVSGGEFTGVRKVGEGDLASSKFQFGPSHLLYGKLRPYLAKIARPDFTGVCSTDILPILPGPKLSRDYMAHFLRQQSMVDLANARASGANLPRLSPKVLASFDIPLPPLEEQRRLGAILDQAEALRAQRRAAIAQLDSLGQAIFVEMFGDPVSAHERMRVADFVQGFESGKSLAAEDEDDLHSPLRVLKVSAVTSLTYRPTESKAVPSDYAPPDSHFVRAGDLLFSRANTADLIGATALVEQTPPNLLLPDKLWRFVWHDPPRAMPWYVAYLFRQKKFRAEVARRASGTSGSMKNISQEKVLGIRAAAPPMAQQCAFSARISAIEALKGEHRSALHQLDALFASLQHRAFRGELTRRTSTLEDL